jgi:CRP-like cAMP-binding protein
MESRAQLRNTLLAALPEENRAALDDDLIVVSLPQSKELYGGRGLIDAVYFPLNCVISVMVSAGEETKNIQAVTIGNEGAVGAWALLGGGESIGNNVVHLAGDALRLGFRQFKRCVEESPRFQHLIFRYLFALTRHMAQESACNQLHTTEERCARWLLMTHDRVGKDSFVFTQEFLAEMMGVRRATVNSALQMLKKAGFIRSERGQTKIVNRKGLEDLACPCYQLIRKGYAALAPH